MLLSLISSVNQPKCALVSEIRFLTIFKSFTSCFLNMFVKIYLASSIDVVPRLVFEAFLSVSFALFLNSLSVFLLSMCCNVFDSLFNKNCFVPCLPNPRFINPVFNSFLSRFFIDSFDSSVICHLLDTSAQLLDDKKEKWLLKKNRNKDNKGSSHRTKSCLPLVWELNTSTLIIGFMVI